MLVLSIENLDESAGLIFFSIKGLLLLIRNGFYVPMDYFTVLSKEVFPILSKEAFPMNSKS